MIKLLQSEANLEKSPVVQRFVCTKALAKELFSPSKIREVLSRNIDKVRKAQLKLFFQPPNYQRNTPGKR